MDIECKSAAIERFGFVSWPVGAISSFLQPDIIAVAQITNVVSTTVKNFLVFIIMVFYLPTLFRAFRNPPLRRM